MEKRRVLLIGLVLALVLGACGTSGSSDGEGSDGGGAGDEASTEVGDLSIEPDGAAAASETIGIDGGSLAVEAADGTTFELTVPEGALPTDTEITATPATLGGTDIPTSLVMFEPSGLFFYDYATLEISAPEEVPVDEQLLFGIDDDATAIVAAPVDPRDPSTTVLVGHFSGYGLARVTEPQRAAMLERQAADAEARIQSRMAEVLGAERRKQLLGIDSESDLAEEFDAASQEYAREVIKPRLEAAGASCAATQKALQTVLGYERQRQLLGMGDSAGEVDGMGILTDALKDDGPCKREAIAACKAAKDPAILIAYLLGVERQRQLLGTGEESSGIDGILEEAKRICLGTTYAASGGGGGLTVSGEVTDLSKPFTLEGTIIGGEATLNYSPTDERSGTYTSSFSGSGVSGSTTGTYTITGEEGEVLTLNGQGSGCVDGVAGSCRSTTEVITLTPVE